MQKNIFNIAVPINYIDSLHYHIEVANPTTLINNIVIVPFRKKNIYGVVLCQDKHAKPQYKIRPITDSLEGLYKLDITFIDFIKYVAQYYQVSLGCVLKSVFPSSIVMQKPESEINDEYSSSGTLPNLSNMQQQALMQIKQYIQSKQNKPILVHGVTGSGKTEVYFNIIKDTLLKKQQVLILVPEIGLSAQLVEQCRARFNQKPLLWHSKISSGQKKKIFSYITQYEAANIIIGVRSAIFLPYKKLGTIIIDEEHDASYKHDNYFFYNARDLAVLRGHLSKIPVLLISATPSLESMHNVEKKKYHYVHIQNRFFSRDLPKIHLIDLQNNKKKDWICDVLKTEIKNTLQKKEKVLLFLNKRGYAPIMVCTNCSFKISCPNCSITLVWHKQVNKMICSYCDFEQTLQKTCPECKKENWHACGPGIERLQETLKILFPKASICTVSKDTMKTQKQISSTIKAIVNDQIDIIIGTQIITKGFNFPKLTLVGVIDADFALYGADLRAKEKTFQILHQVSGRSGREGQKSNVYIQTYFDKSYFMQTLLQNNFMAFAQTELKARYQDGMPPFKKVCKILIKSKKEEIANTIASKIGQNIAKSNVVRMLGPTCARTAKINNEYRVKILIIANNISVIHQVLKQQVTHMQIPASAKVRVDIDPYDFD